jgi:hypothetical protein
MSDNQPIPSINTTNTNSNKPTSSFSIKNLDYFKLGHIGVELVLFAGIYWVLNKKIVVLQEENKTLVETVENLKKLNPASIDPDFIDKVNGLSDKFEGIINFNNGMQNHINNIYNILKSQQPQQQFTRRADATRADATRADATPQLHPQQLRPRADASRGDSNRTEHPSYSLKPEEPERMETVVESPTSIDELDKELEDEEPEISVTIPPKKRN